MVRTTDFSIVSVAEGDFLKQNSGLTYFRTRANKYRNKAEEIEILRSHRRCGVSGSGVYWHQ